VKKVDVDHIDNLVVDELKYTLKVVTDRLMGTLLNQIMIISIAFMIFIYVTHGEIQKFTYVVANISEIFYNGKMNVDFETQEGNNLLSEDVKEFINKHKDFDEMDILNSFVYVLHSSYLVCINHINKVNAALNYLIRYDGSSYLPNIGVVVTYIIIIISVLLNTGGLSAMIEQMFTTSASSSSQYISQIIYHIFSSFVFLFIIYLITSSIVYFLYLLWGIISTASENSSAVLRFFYALLLIIPNLVLFKSLFFKEGMALQQCKDNSSIGLMLFLLLIPVIASIRGVFMLVSTGLIGIPVFFLECTEEKKKLLRRIVLYALMIMFIYTVVPIVLHVFIPQMLKLSQQFAALKVYNSYLPKSI